MKICIIYLAAGNSRRFGSNKLLYPLEGKHLYLHLLEKLVKICERHEGWELVTVTRHAKIMEELKGRPIKVIDSPDSQKGISWSIKAGVNQAWDYDGCAFFAADQPYLREETAEQFLTAAEQKNCALACVCHGGETGNPTWFSKAYFRELAELTGDQGGKRILKKHMEKAYLHPVEDSRELMDLDTPPR